MPSRQVLPLELRQRAPQRWVVSATERPRVRCWWYEALMWVAMSAAEREDFLAGAHVGVLSAMAGTAWQAVCHPVMPNDLARNARLAITSISSRSGRLRSPGIARSQTQIGRC